MPKDVKVTSRFREIAIGLEAKTKIGTKAGAELIEKRAKDRVPVRSGDLQKSIRSEPGELGWKVSAGSRDVPYAMLVEMGTSRTPARPYLIPAFEEAKVAAVTSIVAVLKRHL